MRPSPDNPESCTSSGTLNAPRSSSSGIAVGFSFDWPPVRKFAFDEPWVRPHLGRMAQLWGTMPQRSEGPNFWLNEIKLGVTDGRRHERRMGSCRPVRNRHREHDRPLLDGATPLPYDAQVL